VNKLEHDLHSPRDRRRDPEVDDRPDRELPKPAMFRVDLAFPVANMDEWDRGTHLCRQAAGDASCDSGTGGGERDMQFYYDTKFEADAAAERLRATGLLFVYLDVEECERV
jgi:hypothetical protein